MKRTKRSILINLILFLSLVLSSCFGATKDEPYTPPTPDGFPLFIDVNSDVAYVDYNGGVPSFTIPSPVVAYEFYSPLDGLGRCGVAEACLGPELMPPEDEERDSLSGVTPSGWNQAEYPGIVENNYLYNRCHLIGFQLAGEEANELNLITGTRFMNIEGMLPWENEIARYIEETGNHVMYRVTPVYADKYDLVPAGVILEGLSVEDGGEGISFSVYAYNRQPGIVINYRDGASYLSSPPVDDAVIEVIVINIRSNVFHLPDCQGVSSMSEKNREDREWYEGITDDLITEGYSPCGTCKPTGG